LTPRFAREENLEMTKQIGDFTLDVNTDDRGRIVAEVWHTQSGKTLGIEEVNTPEDAEHWARNAIDLRAGKSS
jgi:hypothetical protein